MKSDNFIPDQEMQLGEEIIQIFASTDALLLEMRNCYSSKLLYHTFTHTLSLKLTDTARSIQSCVVTHRTPTDIATDGVGAFTSTAQPRDSRTLV